MEEVSAAGTLTWRRSEEWGGEGEEESGYSEKSLSFVFWNLAQKKKKINTEFLLKIESFLFETLSDWLGKEYFL